MNERRLILLGPQPEYRSLCRALERLEIDGMVAVTTAGWEEDEGEDAELMKSIPNMAFNLNLFQRSEQLFAEDTELIRLLQKRQDELREVRDVYRMRLDYALRAARETLNVSNGSMELEPERQSAIEFARQLDRQYFVRTSQICDDYDAQLKLSARRTVIKHCRELKQQLAHAEALVISGGHAGIILNRLRIFNLLEMRPDIPIIAWSAGAMALADQIVFFHDSPPQGPGDPEVMRAGMSLFSDVLPLPDARRRLKLEDELRVKLFARRFVPYACVVLDESSILDRKNGKWEYEGNPQELSTGGSLEALVA